MTIVMINDFEIEAKSFKEHIINKQGRELKKIAFHFNVLSEQYHAVTTLLYKNDFEVKVPSKGIDTKAEILNFYTDLTNLYEPGNVGEYYLELIEK